MKQEDNNKEWKIANLKKLYELTNVCGIFTTKTRDRILGVKGLSGRNRTKNDFWYDVRERVKTALIDLQLFIEMSKEKQVNAVLTKESLESIVIALLWSTANLGEPDTNRAEIARLFIKWGFSYLSQVLPDLMTISHEQTRASAVDLADFLAESSKPKTDRHYYRSGGGTYTY
jgi:hypothetical protein